MQRSGATVALKGFTPMQERRPNTLRALVDAYANKRLRRRDPATKQKFLFAINHWSDILQHEPLLQDLTDDLVNDLQDYLLEECDLAENTVAMYVKKILALWRFAFHQRWVRKWPAVDLIDPADPIPIAWTAGQLKILFRTLRSQSGYIGGVEARLWWPAQHWMFWNTSERVRAVMSLRWENVDLDGGFVTFPPSSRKGKRRGAVYQLGPQCIEALRLIQEPNRDKVFPFPYCRDTLWNQYRAILKSAGLPHDRKHMYHCLRKSVASHMEAAGQSSTETLGHSDRSVTRRHYLDPRIVRTVQPANVLFDPESGDGPRAA